MPHVVMVFFRRAQFKVLKPVVGFVAVDVVYLHFRRDGTVERFPYYFVNRVRLGLAINTEGDATILVSITRTEHRVTASTHAIFADPVDATLVASFVMCLKAEDRLPSFHNERR